MCCSVAGVRVARRGEAVCSGRFEIDGAET